MRPIYFTPLERYAAEACTRAERRRLRLKEFGLGPEILVEAERRAVESCRPTEAVIDEAVSKEIDRVLSGRSA